jgi:hypothetical protein
MSYTSPFTGNVIQPTDVSFREITLSANTQLEWPINGNATDNLLCEDHAGYGHHLGAGTADATGKSDFGR